LYPKKIIDYLSRKLFKAEKPFYYHVVLAVLVLLIVLSPIFERGNAIRFIFEVTYLSTLVVSAGFAFRTGSKTMLLMTVILIITLLARVLDFLFCHTIFANVYHSGGLAILLLTFMVIMRSIVKSENIDSNIISGAICGYLIIAIICASLFWIIEKFAPGSFKFENLDLAQISENNLIGEFFYFSIVTLTTVGYGDIVPLSRFSKMLAIMEAVIGQVYLTIIIARLVGIQISEKHQRKNIKN